MENRRKSLLKNTIILSFGALCTKAIMFILIPIIIRLVTTEEYGIFDLLTTYITLLVPILTLGLGEGTFRFLLDAKNEKEKKCIFLNMIISNFIAIIISIIIISIFILFKQDYQQYVLTFTIYLISEIIFDTLGKILRGLKKLNYFTISNILFVIGILLGVIIFVLNLHMGLNGLLLSYILGDIIAIIYMIKKTEIVKELTIKNFEKKILINMIKYSIPVIVSGISWWIVSVSDRTIVSVFLGASINGIYAIANKVPNLCQTFYNMFQLSWLENASEAIKDKDKDEYYNKVYNEVLILLYTISIAILSVNFILFNYIFTEDYFSAYYHSPILVLANCFNMIGTFLGGIYIAKKDTNGQGITVLVSAITNILIHLCLIKFIGLYAASISTLMSYITLYIIRYIDINYKMKIKMKTNKKGKILFILLCYFFISVYINNMLLNYINIVLAMLIFMYFNKNIIILFLNKIKGGKSKNASET